MAQQGETLQEIIDRLVSEGPIGISTAATLFGQFRASGCTQRQTVTRWALDGIALPGGRRVRLEHFRLGHRLMTSKAACLRFIAAQQDGAVEVPVTAKVSKRKTAAKAAGERLAKAGA